MEVAQALPDAKENKLQPVANKPYTPEWLVRTFYAGSYNLDCISSLNKNIKSKSIKYKVAWGIVSGLCVPFFIIINTLYILHLSMLNTNGIDKFFDRKLSWFPKKPLVSYNTMRTSVYSWIIGRLVFRRGKPSGQGSNLQS